DQVQPDRARSDGDVPPVPDDRRGPEARRTNLRQGRGKALLLRRMNASTKAMQSPRRHVRAPFRLPDAPAREELVAKYFRALGEPTRLRIVELLRDDGELTVGEIAARLGVRQTAVSNHVACLRWCGYVVARREHRLVYNRLANGRTSEMIELVRALVDD